MSIADRFKKKAHKKAWDIAHRRTINFNIDKYDNSVKKGLKQYIDHDLAKSRGAYIKAETIANLDKYLLQFEKNFQSNGGKVIWAKDTESALTSILSIFQKHNAKTMVKSKSMTTEEIHLNECLEKNNIYPVETDLGEYIVQLAGQKPYHIVTPAMHMSKEDVSKLFVKKLKIPPTDDPQVLTLTARRLLRNKFVEADIGITGGNFLIADKGGVAITENEGNARMSTAFPNVHIAIVGIEKLIPKLSQLDLFWSLLSTSGTGQKITVYNSVFFGPKKKHELDGPEHMYVILLDNGRTNLLAEEHKRQALQCIRCGACLNTCPVYKNIGGHSYDTTYSGPIGSVITPHLSGMKEYNHLSYASSLCGGCSAVCPVKIDIHNLLLLNRQQAVKEKHNPWSEKKAFDFWAKAMLDRKKMDQVGGRVKTNALRLFLKPTWGKRRKSLKIAPKSFNQLWKERIKK